MTVPALLDRFGRRRHRLPRVVWLLVVGRAVNRLGAFTLPFLTVALTEELDASVTLAGALMAVFGGCTIASRLLGGRLADRFGRRATIALGLVLTAGAQLGLAAAPNLWSAAVAVTLLGLAFEIYEPPSQALVAEVVPPDVRPAAYGLLSAALAAAGVVAGLLAAAVGALDLRLLFVVDAVTCLACALLLWRALPDDARPSAPADVARRTDAPGLGPWRDPRLLVLLASGTAFAAVYLQVSATLGLTLEQRGIPAARVGLLLALSALTVVLGQPLLRWRRLSRLDPWTAMAAGYGLLGAGFLATAVAATLLQFAAATVAWSLGDLLLLGRAHALVAEIAPDHARARYFSVYGLSWGLAAVVGPFAGALLLAHRGPVGLWVTCALLCAALAVAQPALRRSLEVTVDSPRRRRSAR